MSLRKRLISCVLATTVALSTIPTLALSASAEEGDSGRVEWTGFDTSGRTFSTWDGSSYDISWYTGDNGRTVHAGTADDPYLIESSDDLAGLGKLSNNSENLSYGKIDVIYTKAETPSEARTFYDKSMPASDPGAYFYYAGYAGNSISYAFDYDIADTGTTYYADITDLYVKVHDTSTSLPALIEPFKDYLIEKGYTRFISPVDGYALSATEVREFMSSRGQACLTTFLDELLAWNMEDFTASFGDYCEYSLGTLGISYSGYKVVSSTGEVRILDDNVLTNYELYKKLSKNNNVTYSANYDNVFGYPEATSTDSMFFEFQQPATYNSRSYMVSSTVCTPATYYYFKDTRVTDEDYRLHPESVFYAAPTGIVLGTYAAKMSVSGSTLTVKLTQGSTTLATKTVDMSSWTEGTRTNLSANYSRMSLNVTEDGIITVSLPELLVSSDGYSPFNTHVMEDPVLISYDTNAQWTMYDLDGNIVGVYDPAVYSPISFNAIMPKSTYSYYTTMSTLMEDYAEAEYALLPYDNLTADDPSFSGKYFKLACDVDISSTDLSVFPLKVVDGYGFSGDFDLDGHIIRAKDTLIGTINEAGVFHNGTVLTVGMNSSIKDNKGTVKDLLVMSDNLATMTPEGTTKSAVYFVNTNRGTVENIEMKTGVRASSGVVRENGGLIQGVDYLIVHPFESGENYADIGGITKGGITGCYSVVRDVVIDADKDIIGSNTDSIRFCGMVGDGYMPNLSLVENLTIKDFDVSAHYFSSFGIFADVVRNCESYIDNLKSQDTFSHFLGQGTLLENCTIHSSVVSQDGDSLWTTIKDCDIYLAASKFSQSELFRGSNFVNTKLTIDANGTYTFGNNLVRGNIYNSEIRVLDSSDGNTWANQPYLIWSDTIEDSYIYVDNPLAFSQALISISCKSIKNTVFDLPNISKYYAVFGNMPTAVFEDCIFNLKYTGCTTGTSIGSYAHSALSYRGCNWFITFDADCEYSDYSYWSYLPYGDLEDCFISVVSKSDEFAFKDAVFTPAVRSLKIKNTTVLLDNVGIKGAKPCIFGARDNDYSYGYTLFEDVTVLTKNLRVSSDDGLLRLMVGGRHSAITPILSKIYMNVQLAETSRNTGIMGFEMFANGLSAVSDVAVISNTTNPKSALVLYSESPLPGIMLDSYPALLQNTYWDVRGAQNTIIPSETAEGYVPGLFTAYDFSSRVIPDKHFTAGTLLDRKVVKSNIIVPTGNSVVSQYYNADTTTLDSWNATGRRNELWAYSHAPNEDDYGQVVDFIADTSNITYVDDPETAMLDGSLAYMLDNGSSQYRRSRNWTVLEEDVQIKNPVTNEIVGIIPKGLALSNIAIPDDIIEQEVNTDPVYKVIIEDAEMGSVTAQGLADTSSAGEHSIYVKSNTVLHPDERVDNDDVILAYALQSFYGNTPSRIPNQASSAVDTVTRQQENGVEIETVTRMSGAAGDSEYTLDGYSIGSADVKITPVFAYARRVTVSVENNEHGTIIPSATVTAAGEVIRLTLTSDPGYIITDIKANGVPVSGGKFVMPDEDVLITGTVVPFDGGITKFSLFGFEGNIDQYAHTITLTVPRMGNIANAVADIEYVGDFITPSADAHVDFTSPVTYTVTYGEGLTVDYVVTVNQADYTMRIYDFVLDGVHGTINQATRTITVALPVDTDLSNMIPTDISYSAESISPTVMTARDFRVPQVYTLSTAGLSNVSYIVNVVAADESDAVIDHYIFAGYEGEINNTENTITISIPEGMDTDAAVPSLLEYTGKGITPTKTAPLTITDDPLTTGTYTVTAQNGATRTYTLLANYLSSDTAKITEFALGGETGIIDEEEKTITVTLSESVNIVDVAPDTLTYEGKSLYPNKTLEQDFTDPVVYTVVAPDNSEVPYTVEVVRLSNEALITEFEINGYAGVIDQTAKTITVTLPYGTDVSDVAPNKIVYSENAVLSPSATTKRDFTTPQVYNVTSQDNLVSNDYTVTCIVAPDYDNKITRYVLDGVEGVITDIGANLGTIAVTIKERVTMPDYNDIAPSIVTVSDGAILAPVATTKMDFVDNNPVYTVTGGLSGTRTYTVTLTIIPLDRTAEITKYDISDYTGIIDQDAGTITVTVPADADIDASRITPTIEWRGETLVPADNAVVDLRSPVVYTVTAEDPRITKAYTVTLIQDEELSSDCIITKYAVNGNYAVIDQQTGDMTLTVLKSQKSQYEGTIIPSLIEWQGKTLTPDAQTGVNIFDEPVYTVTAENGNTKTYKVKVNIENDDSPASDECIITKYVVNNNTAEINQAAGTITLTVLKSQKSKYEGTKIPDLIEWRGKTLTPNAQTGVNLFGEPTYTVTAESGATKTYTVKVKIKDDDKPNPPIPPRPPKPVDDTCIITAYRALGYDATVDQQTLTITLPVPMSKADALENVVPDKITWLGKTLKPSEREAVTLKDGLEYTVYAEKTGVSKTYKLKIGWIDDRDIECIITAYAARGYTGIVDQQAGTITIEVPNSDADGWTRVVPDSITWRGKTLVPNEGTAVNLEAGTTYRVTAENPVVYRDYKVKVAFYDDDTEEPVDPTEEPVEPTEEPVEPTEEPVEPTEEPTEEPVETEEPDTAEPDETEEPDPVLEDDPDDPETTEPPVLDDPVPDEPKNNPHTGDEDDDEEALGALLAAALAAIGTMLARRRRKKAEQ